MNNNLNNVEVQLADQLQKLAETIADLEIKLDKATKDRERKKLTKAIAEKKALYESLSAGLNDAASEDTKDNSSTPEDTPKAPEEAPAPTPEDTKDNSSTPEDTPKVKATSEEPKVKVKATKTQTPTTSSVAPKVSAKDTAPATEPKTILDMAQDENGNPTKGFTVIVGAILAMILGVIGWWYLYTDTSAVAGAAYYEQATARLKEDIQPAWYRWHAWDVRVKGEAIIKWMPAYRAVYIDNGFTSTKGEATLYACGCVLRALTKKGMSIGDAALRLDSMSFEQFKAALDNDTTLDPSEARAIKRALDN